MWLLTLPEIRPLAYMWLYPHPPPPLPPPKRNGEIFPPFNFCRTLTMTGYVGGDFHERRSENSTLCRHKRFELVWRGYKNFGLL